MAAPRTGGTSPADARLAAACEQARARWPAVVLDAATFAEQVRARVGSVDEDALAELVLPDLWLAVACTLGSPAALEALHADFAAVWRKVFAGATDGDDLEQRFLARLLVGEPARPARIGEYRGGGSLGSWLRVVATRMRVDDARHEDAAERAVAGVAAQPLAPDALDPELAFLKAHYREAFQTAFTSAWTELDPRERNLLRHQLLDGLSATQVAELYNVHRATAKRWLAAARVRLLDGTRAAMRERLRVDTRELDSVLRMVESRLEITARVYLMTADPR